MKESGASAPAAGRKTPSRGKNAGDGGQYAEVGDAVLYHGDCLEIMANLPDESVDMVFADPPYNLSNGGTTVHAGKRVSVNKGGWDASNGPDEDYRFHFDWIAQCRRLLKPDGTLWISGTYHSIYFCGHVLQVEGWRILNDIAWYKPNAVPNLGCRMFTASHETLLWASRSKDSKHVFNYEDMKNGTFPKDFMKSAGKQMRSVWVIHPPGKHEKRHGKHPTQKPEALLDRILRASTRPGDTILDPFCGSGTTGVAALRLGRAFQGIDLNEDFLKKMALPRLRDEGEPASDAPAQPAYTAENEPDARLSAAGT